MRRIKLKANNLIEELIFTFSLFIKHLFLFCSDLVPRRIDFWFVEAAIEKCSTKIRVEKFCYAPH